MTARMKGQHMSRYQFRPHTKDGRELDLIVGYAPGTFFVAVFDRDTDGDPTLVNVGDKPGELTDPDAVIVIVAEHVEPPAGLADWLRQHDTSDTHGPAGR